MSLMLSAIRRAKQVHGPLVTAVAALLFVLALGLVFHGDGTFYKWDTHRDALRQAAVYGILACGMTFVILSGGIDLSVGSVLATTAVVFAMMTIHWQWSAWAAMPLCLLSGAAMGAVSGTVIAVARIQPFIVTLAMMVFARGLAKTLCGGIRVSLFTKDASGNFISLPLPPIFGLLDSRLFDNRISVVTVIFLVCVAVCWVLLARTTWGRQTCALGGNEEAARLAGVSITMMKISIYAISGLFAAVAGICQAAQEQQGDPETGAGYELSAIAIVVIGGTSLLGGSGGIGLTLLGTLTIGYIEKILSINAVSDSGRLMLTGAIIVAAAWLQRRGGSRERK